MISLGGTIELRELVTLAQAIIVTLRLPIQITIPPECAEYFGLTPENGAAPAEQVEQDAP